MGADLPSPWACSPRAHERHRHGKRSLRATVDWQGGKRHRDPVLLAGSELVGMARFELAACCSPKHIPAVARRRLASPDVPSTCDDYRRMWPGVAGARHRWLPARLPEIRGRVPAAGRSLLGPRLKGKSKREMKSLGLTLEYEPVPS